MIEALLDGIESSSRYDGQSWPTWEEQEEEAEAEEEEDEISLDHQRSELPAPQTPGPFVREKGEEISKHQKELFHRLHANTSHSN